MRKYIITKQGIKTWKKLKWKFTFRSFIHAKYDVLDQLMHSKGGMTRQQLLYHRTGSIEAINKAIRVLLDNGDIVVKT